MFHKAFSDPVASEEDIARLFQTVVVGKVDVVKISGYRCTLSVEFKVGRLYSVLFHVSYSSDRQCHDLSDVCQAAQISV
ncbi:hypothetical protein SDC9_176150 [bioreactor metagenome]|uniref:Uncharacterized protein n=1 Tax=bioreactor metagenome TaxID=1076179 RepID=A0A645GPV9_9ZZZZ